MKKNKKIYLCVIVGIFLFALLIQLSPLLRRGFIVTDDGDWMIIRLSAFFQSLKEGQFPVRFLGRLNYGYGYPVANFLYPGFLYIGSLFHIIGFSFHHSVELICIFSIIGSVFLFYFWLRRFFNEIPSLIGALSFLFSPYMLFDLYTRGSIGELLAIFCIIMCLFCIETGNNKVLPFGIFLLMLSHNILAALSIPFLCIYSLRKQSFQSIVPFIIGGMMAAFFWAPAFFERSFVVFNSIPVSQPLHYFDISLRLFLFQFPFLLAGIMAVRRKIDLYLCERRIFLILLITSGIFVTSLSRFVWQLPFMGQYIQFPFRLFTYWLFAGPWLLSYWIHTEEKVRLKKIGIATVLVFIILYVVQYWNTPSIFREEGYYTTNEATTTTHDEYMPRWVKEKPKTHSTERIEFYSGKGIITPRTLTTQRIDATIVAQEESIIQVNTIYYPGWGATLHDRPIAIYYKNPRGLIQIVVPKGEYRLFVEFRETIFRFITDSISVCGLILYGLYLAGFTQYGKLLSKRMKAAFTGMHI